MAVTYPQIGNKVVAKIIEKQGDCTIGMDIGDEFELWGFLRVFLSQYFWMGKDAAIWRRLSNG